MCPVSTCTCRYVCEIRNTIMLSQDINTCMSLVLTYMQGFIQDFFLGGGGGGGGAECTCVAACSYSIDVCKHALSRGVWRHAPTPPPPGKFVNLQLLRWFLVAPETTYTVWFVSASCGQFTGMHGLKVYLGYQSSALGFLMITHPN